MQTTRYTIALNGLEPGVTVRLTLRGPGGRVQTLDAVAGGWTASGLLEPGTWTITAPPVVPNGATYDPQPAMLTLPRNATIELSAVGISYVKR